MKLTENFVLIVISPRNYSWGENCLLTNGNIAYSECSYWSSSPMDNYCFVLVDQDSDELKDDVSPLVNGTNKNILLFWHGENLDGLSDISIDSSLIPCEHFSHGEENHPLKLLMQSVAALPCKDKTTITPTCQSYSKYSDDCREKFDKLVALYLGKANLELIPELLPLDIDMQMLNDLSTAEAIDYLRRMLVGPSIYTDNKNRFERILKLKSKVTDPKVRSCLNDLIGGDETSSLLYKFLASIDTFRNANVLTDSDVKSVVNSSGSLEKETFHQWFCDMASCLKGRKMCAE